MVAVGALSNNPCLLMALCLPHQLRGLEIGTAAQGGQIGGGCVVWGDRCLERVSWDQAMGFVACLDWGIYRAFG